MPPVRPSPLGQAGFLIEVSGDVAGLPDEVNARVRIQRVPPAPNEPYDVGPPLPTGTSSYYPPELTCLDEIDHLEPEETVAVVKASNGWWGRSGLRACLCKLACNSPLAGAAPHSNVQSLGLTGALSVRQGQVEGQRGPGFLGKPFDVYCAKLALGC